jgi:leucyl aminopeptidase (aminopeptidase T)
VLGDRPIRRTLAGPSLLETLDASGEHGRSLAELAIGTNPAATLIGNMLEDENVIDTMHLAFGTSAGLGGVNVAGVHINGIVLHPSVELDGERVLDDGRLRVSYNRRRGVTGTSHAIASDWRELGGRAF